MYNKNAKKQFLYILLAGLSVLATSLLMSPIFVVLRDVWIRTQSAAVASRRVTNLTTHLFKGSLSDVVYLG